jgi:pimeloyl-ACP methyl ester carboxylesterase
VPTAHTDDGVSIEYLDRGGVARALVLLHAWGASASYFDEMVEHLDPGEIRAIAIDLRGHGGSDKPDTPPTWDRLARDVFAVADDAGARSFVAFGHSLGGKLAQYLLLVDPARVDALVLIASPSAGSLPIPDSVAGWPDLAGQGQELTNATVVPFLKREVPAEVLRRFGENAARIPRDYLRWTMELVGTSFGERLATTSIPALIVSSAGDPLHTTESELTSTFPAARVTTVDTGSEIPMEAPAELATLIAAFVSELPSGSGARRP